MIELIVNDTALELNPDTKIRVEWNNPVFTEDTIDGNIVYWFDINFSHINNKAFGHFNIPGIAGKTKTYDATLRLFSLIEIKGKLIVKSSKTNYRVAFTTNDLIDYKETWLNDITWDADVSMGTTTDDVESHAEAKILLDYPDTNYNFPVIKNPGFYGDENPSFLGYMNFRAHWDNEFLPNLVNFRNYRKPLKFLDPEVSLNNVNALVPQLYLQYIINKLFSYIGYNIAGNFISDSLYQQILVYCNYALDETDDEYYVKASSPSPLTGDQIQFASTDIGTHMTFNGAVYTIQHEGYVNFTLFLDLSFPSHNTGITCQIKNITQDVVIDEIVLSAGEVSDNQTITLYASHLCTLRTEENDLIGFFVSREWSINSGELEIIHSDQLYLNRYKKILEYDKVVPHIKINTFLNGLKSFFNMALFWEHSQKNAEWFFLKDIFEAQAIDLTDKIQPGEEIELQDNKNLSIQFIEPTDGFIDDSFNSPGTIIGNYTTYYDLPDPIKQKLNDYAFVTAERAYYKVKRKDFENPTWEYYANEKQAFQYNTDGEVPGEKEIKILPLLTSNYMENYGTIYACIVSKINAKGKSDIYITKEEDKEDDLRLFIWHGMKYSPGLVNPYSSTDYPYPYASAANYDSEGNKLGNLHLNLKGDEGIVETFHAPWLDYIKNIELVTFKAGVNYTLHDLQATIKLLSAQNGVTISNQTRWIFISGIKYLPKQVTAEITMQGLESVEIKAIKQAH